MEDDEELDQVSDCSLDMHLHVEKTNLIAEWTAKHSISLHPDQVALARRKLPEAPGKSSPESTDDSLVDVNHMLATNQNYKKSKTRPFERLQNLSLKDMGTQRNIQGPKENDLASKQDNHFKPVWRTSSKVSSSSIPNSAGSSTIIKPVAASSLDKAPSRSNSSLTSREADFQTSKKRKDYKQFNSSERKTLDTVTTCAKRQTSLNPQCKQRLKKAQSLTMNGHEISMKRANSFHHGSACQSSIATLDENEDNIEDCEAFQFRKMNSYYLDEDELILHLFPAEQTDHIMHHRPCKPSEELSALDSLVISTSHSVSSKLCQSAARMVRQADNLFPEDDEDQALTIETVTYLLEDTHISSSYRSRVSAELAGTLKNFKKLEQAFIILDKVLDIEEE